MESFKQTPIILALDLGTITGWALSVQDCPITSGTVSFKLSRYEGGGIRYLRLLSWLDKMLDVSEQIDLIYFEEVRRHSSTDAAHVYGGFLSHLTAWCEKMNIPYQGVPVGTIKKHITGKGNAKKEMVIKAVKSLGYHPLDDNEADALSLLLWAKAQPFNFNQGQCE